MIRAGVVGASGYLGGELIRLLLGHPEVTLAAAVSSRMPGRRIDTAHPNLRGVTDQSFIAAEQLPELDVLLMAAPHRETMRILPGLAARAKVVIDLSGDFRLADAQVYE